MLPKVLIWWAQAKKVRWILLHCFWRDVQHHIFIMVWFMLEMKTITWDSHYLHSLYIYTILYIFCVVILLQALPQFGILARSVIGLLILENESQASSMLSRQPGSRLKTPALPIWVSNFVIFSQRSPTKSVQSYVQLKAIFSEIRSFSKYENEIRSKFFLIKTAAVSSLWSVAIIMKHTFT